MNEYIIENFLDENQENLIEEMVINPDFHWDLMPGNILPPDIKDNPFIIPVGLNPPQFIHRINIDKYPYNDLLSPILKTLAIEFESDIYIIGAKFNLLTKSDSNQFHFPRTNVYETNNVYTAIYYVTDSDGPTYLFDQFGPKESDEVTIKTTIEPQKGKLAIFKADRFHASSSPVESDIRIVLNIVFKTH
jgi:hypothetical protein